MTAGGSEEPEARRARLLAEISPRDLVAARRSTHQAAQIIADAARANLAAAPDYSHMSLDWRQAGADFYGLASQPFANGARLSLSLSPAQLNWLTPDGAQVGFKIDAQPVDMARSWADGLLVAGGLKPAAAVEPDQIAQFAPAEPVAFAALYSWFSIAADALTDVAAELASLTPGPSPVRCWPHHFDIATYVALEAGDPETAKGIGVGLSPGDESHDQPYFYINPWPAPAAGALPAAPAPGAWMTEGFTGIVATGEAVLAAGLTSRATLGAFLSDAVAVARRALQA